MIKLILQHVLSQGQSQRRCAQALGISKGVVAKYVAAAQAVGLTWAAIEPLAEHELEARLIPARGAAQAPLPDFPTMHRELARKGVTLMLLWQEYQADHLGRRTLQYSQFCERYHQYTRTLKRSMRQV
ncbi:IS21 family transposase, partial [Castellaniella sp. GW247-6E4]